MTTVSISVIALTIVVAIIMLRTGRVTITAAIVWFLAGFLAASTSVAPGINGLIHTTTRTSNSITTGR
ncbi:hypothetical protein [Streptacidiphilus carbonis]|uniref:hypothetical protein n=1 Tax=Streptacidiphilus carbonis TaxID=105422 RepID=UPI0005A7A23E|nr:hypothetical protein [Streptacidiphilus carbonis]